MFLTEFILALGVAIVATLLYIPFAGRRRTPEGGPEASALLFFFAVLLFATWAGGIWLTPLGPDVWGAYWMPFVLVGLFVALLLIAATEPGRRRNVRPRMESEERIEVETATAFGLMFWILMIGLLVAIYAGYTLR